MARLASQQVAGFYETPRTLLESILMPLVLAPSVTSVVLCDPCAGEGFALSQVYKRLKPVAPQRLSVEFMLCELEKERHAKAVAATNDNWNTAYKLCGDAFNVHFAKGVYHAPGASVLFLNPPYDHHAAEKRLEQAFLTRFTPVLADNGVLVYIVPFATLAVSAAYLVEQYQNITVFKFTEPEFSAFSQVVVYAVKRALPLPPTAQEVAHLASLTVEALPDLTAPCRPYAVPYGGVGTWAMAPVDITSSYANYTLWGVTSKQRTERKAASGLLHSAQDLTYQEFPVAMPLRAAHIAQALAAGIFNGQELTPQDARLPHLMVKGSFVREFHTVETQHNQRGEAISETQVEAPRLSVTALDLSTLTYFTFAMGVEPTGQPAQKDWNVADFIVAYQDSLLDVLERQCPPLQTWEDTTIPLPTLARVPFPAQETNARAALALLNKGESAYIVGEVGSGKSSVALHICKALSPEFRGEISKVLPSLPAPVKKAIILCPPHLLDGWAEQVKFALPEAVVVNLDSIASIEALALNTAPLVIALLSREKAKLGSARISGLHKGKCSKCGTPPPFGVDVVETRAFCQAVAKSPTSKLGVAAKGLALYVAPEIAGRKGARALLGEQAHALALEGTVISTSLSLLQDAIQALLVAMQTTTSSEVQKDYASALVHLCFGYPVCPERDELLESVLRVIIPLTKSQVAIDSIYQFDDFLGMRQLSLLADLQAGRLGEITSYTYDALQKSIEARLNGRVTPFAKSGNTWGSELREIEVSPEGTEYTWNKVSRGSKQAVVAALYSILPHIAFSSEACGNALWQLSAEPRRYPLAQYIAKKHKNLFDFYILDELQDFNNGDAAQAKAAHRLLDLKKPAILLSGTVSNGYARSLFGNMWKASPAFRQHFGYGEAAKFVDQFGYKKRKVVFDDGQVSAVRGSMTDRTQKVKSTGDAPGILPLFLIKHLLPIATTLQKDDVIKTLPKMQELRVPLTVEACDADLLKNYENLYGALVERIKSDHFTERSGQLFGMCAELPSYLDRANCDTGNLGDAGARQWSIHYPDEVTVAATPGFDAKYLSPKERWLLALVKEQVARDRRVLLFVWHTGAGNGLVQRLQGLLKTLNVSTAVMDPAKVPTAKRQAWIEKNVVQKDVQVLISNPTAIQTGLNNLVHFSTAVWYENPSCNAIVYRQANGRLHRIGQTKEVEVYLPVYGETIQDTALQLLMRKVSISTQLDGLDARSALEASGAGGFQALDVLAVGRAIYESVMLRGNRRAA